MSQEDYKFKAYQGYRASSNPALMDLVPGSVECLPSVQDSRLSH